MTNFTHIANTAIAKKNTLLKEKLKNGQVAMNRVTKKPKLDVGQLFSRFMFMTLHQAARQWAWMMTGAKMHPKIESRLNKLIEAETNFFNALKEVKGTDETEFYDDTAQIFSDLLLHIHKCESVEKKQEIVTIIRQFLYGDTKVVRTEYEILLPFAQHLDKVKNRKNYHVKELQNYLDGNI